MRPALLVALLLLVAACDRVPTPPDLREWTANDHDRVDEKVRAQAGGQPGQAMQRNPQEYLAEATWGSKCANCHGPIGHGDGPLGPQNKASDLTNPAWQTKVSDAEIIATIRNGKGDKMPAFKDLGDEAVAALIARIRASRGQ